MILHELFRVVSCFPHYISCYIAENGFPLGQCTLYSIVHRLCVTRFSTSSFFHDSNPSGSLINRLKYFLIRFRFRRDIRIFKKLHGVHPTTESDSALCIIPRSRAPWCASHSGVNNLISVCLNPKFYECYFSVMPRDINMKFLL